ncbi:helix-turn-helix domain-containing protein [Allokutzneria multivorans]
MTRRPTLDEIRQWPATVNVQRAAEALGVSRAHLYDAINQNRCPATVIFVGTRRRVVTDSLLALLEDSSRLSFEASKSPNGASTAVGPDGGSAERRPTSRGHW